MLEPIINTMIVNLTPHPLNLMAEDGCVVTFEPAETPARVEQTRELVLDLITECFHNAPVTQSYFGEVTGVPDPAENTFYVVSLITAQALKAQGRTEDILIVDAAVRDEKGHIIGCRGFARV
jgi:hypothetical protein